MWGQVDPADHMRGFLEVLDKEKEKNTFGTFELPITRNYSDKDNLLWRIVSHPYSKLLGFDILERDPDALAASQVLKVVKKWYEEIPATGPRRIFISFDEKDTERSRETFDDLRQILQSPNNHVKDLYLFNAPPALRLCESVLRPVFEHPDNEVEALMFSSMKHVAEDEVRSLTACLASSECKLKAFYTSNNRLTLADARLLLNGLYALPNLEYLKWENSLQVNSEEGQTVIAIQLAHLLEKPGNVLRVLTLAVSEWQKNQVAIFAKALKSPNCRVEELECNFSGNGPNLAMMQLMSGTFVNFPRMPEEVAHPLFDLIRHDATDERDLC